MTDDQAKLMNDYDNDKRLEFFLRSSLLRTKCIKDALLLVSFFVPCSYSLFEKQKNWLHTRKEFTK